MSIGPGLLARPCTTSAGTKTFSRKRRAPQALRSSPQKTSPRDRVEAASGAGGGARHGTTSMTETLCEVSNVVDLRDERA